MNEYKSTFMKSVWCCDGNDGVVNGFGFKLKETNKHVDDAFYQE